MTGADLLVQALAQRGVTFVATLSGNGLNPFYVACKRAGLRVVDFRNEQAAAYAADAAARLTGRLAVCAVSSAVGHVNALIGVLNAHYDGAPVLLLSGASEHARTDMGKFQELDQISLAEPICKYARLVDRPERIPFFVQEAAARATAPRPGPVHLTVPIDVLSAEVSPEATQPIAADAGLVAPRGAPDPSAVSEAARLLAAAERPVIVAGSGAFYARADDALEALATDLAAPVVVPIWDRGAVPRAREHFLGVVGAASGEPRVVADADLLLLVGARVDYRLGYGEPPGVRADVRVVRVDADPSELTQGREPDVAIQASPAFALAALRAEAARRGIAPKRGWLAEARRRDREFRARWAGPLPTTGPLTGRHVVEALRPIVGGDRVGGEALFLVDGGNIGQWAHMALVDRYPGHWLTCGASGVVGWGLGGAIGAKLACPDRPVILLSGDGAIGFTIAELESAVRQDAPFIVVLADDRAWGIVVSGQEERYGSEGVIASRLGQVRYDLVAEGFGAVGVRVERQEEIGPAVLRALESGRPTLVHVPIAPGGPSDR